MSVIDIILVIYLGSMIVFCLGVWIAVFLRRKYNAEPLDVGINLYSERPRNDDKIRDYVFEFSKVEDEDILVEKRRLKELDVEFVEYGKRHDVCNEIPEVVVNPIFDEERVKKRRWKRVG